MRGPACARRAPILVVSYSGAFGGSERVLAEVAGRLCGEVCVGCPPGPLERAARASGVRVLVLRSRPLELRGGAGGRMRAAVALAGHASELARLTADLDPAVLVLWGMRPALGWLLALGGRAALDRRWGLGGRAALGGRAGRARAGARRVVIAHHDMLPGGGARVGIAAAVRAAARRADAVVANSRAVAADLDPSGALGSRLSVVYPGVSPEPAPAAGVGSASVAGADAGSAPAEGWPSGPPVVAVIGALTPWKRADLALEAIAIARRSVPSLRLRIVGAPLVAADAAFVSQLRARAAQRDLAGAVEFVGAVDDPRPLLAQASCLLHCADREPFGLVVAEALAAGRPAVVPAAGGPAEIVDDRCGLSYPPGDAQAAAAAITSLVCDPERARAMAAAGRERVAARFTPEAMHVGYRRALGEDAPAGTAGAAGTGAARTDAAGTGAARTDAAERDAGGTGTLALVTVTHNSSAELARLLGSVERHLPGVRVIVVDCDSADDSLAVARAHPLAVAVDAGENLGFGRGSNLGLSHVTEPVTVLINPDVELIDDSLAGLAAAALDDRPGPGPRLAPADGDPEPGPRLAPADGGPGPKRLLAPLVLSSDGSRQDTVHPAPGTAAELARLVVAPALAPWPVRSAVAPWRSRRPRRVGWAVGCALAGRTETLRSLGPFSDEIFLYGEDLELGLRAATVGIETWFWPAARVIHERAHSTSAAYGGEPFTLLAAARHRAISIALGPRRARADDLAQAALFGSRALVKRLLGRDAERERRQLRAVVAQLRAAGRR